MPAQDLHRRLTILIVDDDDDVLETMIRVLTEYGYAVLAARDGYSALRLLESRSDIDLLFTDVMMPGGLNGFSLATRAKRLRPDLRILYATGYTSLQTEIADELGKVIAKPYDFVQLRAEIERSLAPRA